VLPGVVRRTDRFRVTWAPGASATASTRYRVRFTRFRDPFGALVWESGETDQTGLDVEPGRLPAGEYDVVVVAREGASATFSAAALLRVVDAP
jgi:hypothetical protein